MNFTQWMTEILSNFGFIMFILAILISLLDWPIHFFRKKASGFEVFYRWVALLALGVTSIYAFILHAFFSELSASTIGWQTSPFQFEVAVANLAFGIIAILSFNASYGFRLATVIGSTIWLWGNAVGHIYQMLVHQNYSTGNAGSWFWMDIIVPLVLIITIIKLKPKT